MTGKQNQVAGILVKEVLGWKETNDKKHVLVGIKDGADGEMVLAVTPDNAMKIATSLLSFVGQSRNQRGLEKKQLLTFEPNLFEVGKVEASERVALSFYMPDEAALSFQLPKAMAQDLFEMLGAALGAVSTAPPTETTQH